MSGGFSSGAETSPRSATHARAVIVALLVTGIIVLHYSLTRQIITYHDMLRRSMYVPIILAAVWFGTRGGVGVAALAALLYAPHLFLQHRLSLTQQLDRSAEMLLYVIVGGLTGLLVERERMQRQRTERALAQLEEAHAALQRQAAELEQVQENLRHTERLSTLGELAADLAHEIRNPLATMRGTVQILSGSPPEAEKREFANMLLGEVDRLNGVVEGYLRAARAGRGTVGSSDAVTAIESVIQLTRRQAADHGVGVSRTGADRILVGMDAGRLTQVFMNLALNAIQAMPGGGSVHIGCRVARDEEAPVAEFTVSDSGPGISPAEREMIFRPFYTTREGGTGLGLSIAKRLIEEQGGSLTVGETAGRGTTFHVRIPAVTP